MGTPAPWAFATIIGALIAWAFAGPWAALAVFVAVFVLGAVLWRRRREELR